MICPHCGNEFTQVNVAPGALMNIIAEPRLPENSVLVVNAAAANPISIQGLNNPLRNNGCAAQNTGTFIKF